MLTQIQLTEPQAALLAACPRPRAVVSASVLTVSTPEVSMSTQRPWTQWPQPQSAPVLAAAPVRVARLGAVAVERPAASGRPAYAAAVAGVIGGEGVIGANGFTSSKQHKQHLTDRRGLVTWRPPH